MLLLIVLPLRLPLLQFLLLLLLRLLSLLLLLLQQNTCYLFLLARRTAVCRNNTCRHERRVAFNSFRTAEQYPQLIQSSLPPPPKMEPVLKGLSFLRTHKLRLCCCCLYAKAFVSGWFFCSGLHQAKQPSPPKSYRAGGSSSGGGDSCQE